MAIVTTRLTTTQLDALTVPASKSYAITNILVCNNGGAAATFDMHFIPSGDPLNNNITRVINGLSVDATETFTFDSEKIVLSAGDKISFVASPDVGSGNTNLSAMVSYLEV
tara:strand:- start:2274 stop:2606 length:333 start_codon:yes stop_codon:yes gene_type:complete